MRPFVVYPPVWSWSLTDHDKPSFYLSSFLPLFFPLVALPRQDLFRTKGEKEGPTWPEAISQELD